MIKLGYGSNFELATDTQYLTLTMDTRLIYGVFLVRNLRKNVGKYQDFSISILLWESLQKFNFMWNIFTIMTARVWVLRCVAMMQAVTYMSMLTQVDLMRCSHGIWIMVNSLTTGLPWLLCDSCTTGKSSSAELCFNIKTFHVCGFPF